MMGRAAGAAAGGTAGRIPAPIPVPKVAIYSGRAQSNQVGKRVMQGEISYDLIMQDDMTFVEGSYRIGEGDWQVFIIRKDPVEKQEVTQGRWPSGVTGVFARVPLPVGLNKQAVERLMSELLGVLRWREVRGPDSMQLR
jgi:hypothetical protein